MRVYIDASVIIAALLSPSGGSALVLTYVKQGKIIGITSQTVLFEVLKKTAKIKKSPAKIHAFINLNRLLVRQPLTISEITPYQKFVSDPKDVHVVAGAKLTKCHYLITLDKRHLLKSDVQKKVLPLQIVSPKEMLEKLVEK